MELTQFRVPRPIRKILFSAATVCYVAAAGGASAETKLLHEEQSVKISASADTVWAVASSFADLTWVPAVKASAATKGNRIGSVRTLDFGGPKLTETLVKYDAKHRRYTYRIDNTESNQKVAPLSDVEAEISVVAGGANSSIATWKASFHRVDHSDTAPAGSDDATAQKQMAGTITMGLGGLKARSEAK